MDARTHTDLWRGLLNYAQTFMHTSTNTSSRHTQGIQNTGAQSLLFLLFSLGEKHYPPSVFKTLCLPPKHTHACTERETQTKGNAVLLNHRDLDLGHQLYNECLQKRDKWCLTCFHLLWWQYTDFPQKPNRAISLNNLVGRSNEQRQQDKDKEE